MKRYIIFIFLALVLVRIFLYYKERTKNAPQNLKTSFITWYNIHYKKKKANPLLYSTPKVYCYEYVSPELIVDTIYRSMQGPLTVKPIKLASPSFYDRILNKKELIWLVGYSAEVIDEKGNKVSDDFLCHNNLDITDKADVPWKIHSTGSFCRLFTLTAGQTNIQLPNGFGIPIFSDEDVSITCQALNHNIFPIHIKTRQRVKIFYIKESELTFSTTPLYQQAVFVTKQTDGPKGNFGLKTTADSIATNYSGDSSTNMSCCSGILFDSIYNPFEDHFGRKYTGHWSFDSGEEQLSTDITQMLHLPYSTRVHFIGVHVHPFCRSLSLFDKTTGELIFESTMQNYSTKIGLSQIDYFTSIEGKILKQGHEYELKSIYRNTSKNIHTAMATMFLYLEDL